MFPEGVLLQGFGSGPSFPFTSIHVKRMLPNQPPVLKSEVLHVFLITCQMEKHEVISVIFIICLWFLLSSFILLSKTVKLEQPISLPTYSQQIKVKLSLAKLLLCKRFWIKVNIVKNKLFLKLHKGICWNPFPIQSVLKKKKRESRSIEIQKKWFLVLGAEDKVLPQMEVRFGKALPASRSHAAKGKQFL